MLNTLSQPEVRKIIADNIGEKPEVFALKFRSQTFPVATLATQLKYLQRSKDKLPSLYAVQAIIPPLSYEQCSSEATAALKQISGERILDLTAGLGIDSLYFSKQAREVIAVERNMELQEIVKYNFSLLGVENVRFVNDSAENFIQQYQGEKFDWIFIDPARRDDKGGKVFLPEDLQPNILTLLPILEKKCHRLMVKMSPLYDVAAALNDFPNIAELRVVSIDNECKELLLIWDFSSKKLLNTNEITYTIIASIKQKVHFFSFKSQQLSNVINLPIHQAQYLYEPDVSFYKSRLTTALFSQYYANTDIFMTHPQGFFLSNMIIPDFCGRVFRIKMAIPYNPKKIQALLKENHIVQANILQRNFPHSVAEIRQALKVKEGGKDFLICSNFENKEKWLFWGEKNEP